MNIDPVDAPTRHVRVPPAKDSVEHAENNRAEKLALIRLGYLQIRVTSGYYSRAGVIDHIADRILATSQLYA